MLTAPRSRQKHRLVTVSVFAILVVAALLRLRGIAFGLPALYDPDEPIFLLTALKLLRNRTLNPGWFGHPGTTTIYALALIDLAVLGIGMVTGRFASVQDFGKAIYADPGVVILPGRWFIVVCGLATILLTFILARSLFGARAGVLAAGLLTIDPIHIKYSQIIRTDMHETVFLLLCMLACVNIARRGRMADYAWAALWLGLACATKWPAVTVVVSIIGAAGYHMAHNREMRHLQLVRLILVGPLALAALVAASPFLVLDLHTVLVNLSGEARTHHPGATGQGFWWNAGWYVSHPLRDAVTALGVGLAAIGFAVGSRRAAVFAVTIASFAIISLIAVSAQALLWERWIVPLLPFVAIAMAVALDTAIRRFATPLGRMGSAVVLGAVVIPSLIAGEAASAERAHDTRAEASTWARAHIPPGSSVIVEQLAFDLLRTGWRFLYPVGDAGCVDVAASLRAKIPYSTIERWRAGRPVIDFGTIAPETFPTCRADYAIIVDYDRYLLEPQTYAAELRTYRRLIEQGAIVATFRAAHGKTGGPTVRIVRLNPRSSGWHVVAPAS